MEQALNKFKSFSNTRQLKITKLLACLKTENSIAFFFVHLYSLFLTLKKKKKVHISSYKLTSVVYVKWF